MGLLKWNELVEVIRTEHVIAVRKAIIEKYDFDPGGEYCRDLIAFVNTLAPHEEASDEPRE